MEKKEFNPEIHNIENMMYIYDWTEEEAEKNIEEAMNKYGMNRLSAIGYFVEYPNYLAEQEKKQQEKLREMELIGKLQDFAEINPLKMSDEDYEKLFGKIKR